MRSRNHRPAALQNADPTTRHFSPLPSTLETTPNFNSPPAIKQARRAPIHTFTGEPLGALDVGASSKPRSPLQRRLRLHLDNLLLVLHLVVVVVVVGGTGF